MAQQVSGQQTGANKASWLDRAVDILKPQPGPPPKPPGRERQKDTTKTLTYLAI